MRTVKAVLGLGIVFFSHQAIAGDSYLCVADQVVGFRYSPNQQTWGAASFKADEKYFVKPADVSGDKYSISRLGFRFPVFECDRGFNDAGVIRCTGMGEFVMSTKTMRFLSSYTIGYFNTGDPGADTPALTIGTCTRM
jgi:hypothetical protein